MEGDASEPHPSKPSAGLSHNKQALIRVAEIAVGLIAVLALLQWAFSFSLLDAGFWTAFAFPSQGTGLLFRGLLGTLEFTAIVIPTGLAFGFLWGWARASQWRFLSWPTTVIIEFLRGVPPVILVIFAYFFGTAFVPRGLDPFAGAVLIAAFAIGLHTGAYQAEIFRAGFQSVPRGQVEAAEALGMTRRQTMANIVLPQALRLSLPPLGNEFSNVIKDTALLAAIGASELFGIGLEFNSRAVTVPGHGSWLFLLWVTIAAAYYVLNFAVSQAMRYMERRMAVPGLGGAGG
jgi:arginine/lysine/histidine transport system permease protein